MTQRTLLLALLLLSLSCLSAQAGCPFARLHLRSSPSSHVHDALERFFSHPDHHAVAVQHIKQRRGAADPLDTMNHFLQSMYAENKMLMARDTFRSGEPWIVLYGSELILAQWDDKTAEIRLDARNQIPDLFTNLKLVSHVGLTSLVLAEGVLANGTEVSAQAAGDISLYLEQFDAAYASLAFRDFSDEQMERSVEILDICKDFLEGILQSRMLTEAEVEEFGERVKKPTVPHITDAAIAIVDNAHQVVSEWKEKLSPFEWQNLKVLVVGGSHMARDMSWSVQYFARMLNTSMTSGERIIYAEAADLDGAIDLIGTHLIDFAAGEAYWDEPTHMHQDILAPATKEYLPWLIPDDEQKAHVLDTAMASNARN
eukprot:TRINITY_DN1936_c2_g1_i1.p1 TRINITY_DN1936_c2_g1~~TRINITY_DN1936_c2_g1_i1.p1  ORF type:complete len:371 (+),score=108.64 TRINITY_DN1936_c2_g1_i1:53-1165(+)